VDSTVLNYEVNSVRRYFIAKKIDEDQFLFLAAAAEDTVIILRRRERRRLLHQKKIWSRDWLLQRTSDRSISHFVDYELREDACGFHGFLRMSSGDFNEILEMTHHKSRNRTLIRCLHGRLRPADGPELCVSVYVRRCVRPDTTPDRKLKVGK
jgi:hypothetical protein